MKIRKTNPFFENISKQWKENPIVERLEDEFPEKKTEKKHIEELQVKLTQTIIDYCKENNLTDVDAVNFSFDGIQNSVEYGEWSPASDSSIRVTGIAHEVHRRKNGEIFKMPFWFEIGESF